MSSSRRSGALVLILLVLALLIGGALWLVLQGDAASSVPADEPIATVPDDDTERDEPERREPTPRDRVDTASIPDPTLPPRAEPDDVPDSYVFPPGGKPLVRTIAVTVLREDGGPAADTRVAPFSGFANVVGIPADARTDVEGRATVMVTGRANFRLRAWTEDAAVIGERLATEPGGEDAITLRLEAGRHVAGRVESDDGRALDGATVTLRLATDDAFGLAVGGTTGPEGHFDLGTLPTALLDDADVLLEASAAGHAPLTEPYLPHARDAEIVLRLVRGQTVRGRFVAVGNAPVGGVRVEVQGTRWVLSGDDGTFELAGLPPTGARMLISPPDHVTPPFIDLPASRGVVDLGDIVLEPGLPVSGVVVDAAGTPLAGAQVHAAHPELGFVKHTTTDDEGRFTLPAIGRDEHVVVAQAPDDGTDWSARRAARQTGVNGGTAGLRLELSGALSVVVTFRMETDRSEVRVASAEVTTLRTDVDGAEMRSAWSGPGMTSVRVQLLEAGIYDVTVSVPGYEAAHVRGVTVLPDREVSINALFRVKPE